MENENNGENVESLRPSVMNVQLARPASVPPEQYGFQENTIYTREESEDPYLRSEAYHVYYSLNKNLNPRLTRPLPPNNSTQYPSKNTLLKGMDQVDKKAKKLLFKKQLSPPRNNRTDKKSGKGDVGSVVSKIQEDFPDTDSPAVSEEFSDNHTNAQPPKELVVPSTSKTKQFFTSGHQPKNNPPAANVNVNVNIQQRQHNVNMVNVGNFGRPGVVPNFAGQQFNQPPVQYMTQQQFTPPQNQQFPGQQQNFIPQQQYMQQMQFQPQVVVGMGGYGFVNVGQMNQMGMMQQGSFVYGQQQQQVPPPQQQQGWNGGYNKNRNQNRNTHQHRNQFKPKKFFTKGHSGNPKDSNRFSRSRTASGPPSHIHQGSSVMKMGRENPAAARVLLRLKGKFGDSVPLNEIIAHSKWLSTDQIGSRCVQKRLVDSPPDERNQLFSALQPHLVELMRDVFGNYVVQKLLESPDVGIVKHVLGLIKSRFSDLSRDKFGCRVVQKAVEVVDKELVKSVLFPEIERNVVECVNSQNGNHVIQKCIEIYHGKDIEFIVRAFSGRVREQAIHPYGCRVIQRLLENCTEKQKVAVLGELFSHLDSLITNAYANYVLQHILETNFKIRKKNAMFVVDPRFSLHLRMKGRLLEYCYDKYASNVVEKAYEFGNDNERSAIIDEFTKLSIDDKKRFFGLMNHKFGNYVFQRMIEKSSNAQKLRLMRIIGPLCEKLKLLNFGKHIANALTNHCGHLN